MNRVERMDSGDEAYARIDNSDAMKTDAAQVEVHDCPVGGSWKDSTQRSSSHSVDSLMMETSNGSDHNHHNNNHNTKSGGSGSGGGSGGGAGGASSSSVADCSKSWREPRHSFAEPFKSSSVRKVNAMDFTIDKLQFDNLGQLYGREKEVAQLKDIFEKASVHDNKKQLVLLKGPAGSGKSALALEVRSFVKDKRGFYLSGKFDEQANASFEQPYSAIAEACQAICEDILLHKVNMEQNQKGLFKWTFTYDQFMGAIRNTLDGDQIELLGTVIPSLKKMIEEEDDLWQEAEQAVQRRSSQLMSSAYTGSKQRLKNAFRRFVRSICSLGSVVVVLDDLQWADEASIELIEALLTDDEIISLMAIFTFRDNEVEANEGFMDLVRRVEDIAENPLSITRLQTTNLDVAHINLLLQDLIHLNADEVCALGECIAAKTDGNALYVKVFLLSLRANDLLSFNFGTMRWHWDVDQIKEKTMATENVVNLLTAKIKKLPPLFADFLPRIACLGSRFSAEMFEAVAERYNDDGKATMVDEKTSRVVAFDESCKESKVDSDLQNWNADTLLAYCETTGFLMDCGNGWHQWEHGKVREAVLALVDEEDIDAVQFEVGTTLLNKLSEEDIAPILFVVTTLLNSRASALDAADPQRLVIAELNLRSGQAAFMSSAFRSASEYLSTGIDLLPQNPWKSHYEMTMDLYSTASEACFCAGDFVKSKMYGDQILGMECSLLEKRRAYNALLFSLVAQARTAEAKDLCVEILAKLGCKFPKRRRRLFVKVGMMRIVATMDRTAKKVEKLKQMEDDEKIWAIYLFDRLATCCYQAKDPDLFALCILRGLDWTVKYGISDGTGAILALIGTLLVTIGNFAGGWKFALLAMKYSNRSLESRLRMVVYRHVIHFSIPNETCKKELMKGYEAGIRSGDLESAFWCICGFCDEHLNTATRLSDVIKDYAMYSRQIAKHNNTMAGRRMWLGWQYAANLAEPDSNRHVLTGDIIDEVKFLEEIENDKNDKQTLINFLRFKLAAAFWFKEFETAVQVMEKAGFHKGSCERGKPGANIIGQLYFYCALSCISLARETKEGKKGKNRKSFDWFLGRMKHFSEKGNPKMGHYRALMEAELLSLNGAFLASKQKFDEAILLSGRMGFTHDRALSHERLADDLRRKRFDRDASYHYDMALKLYEEWGAKAKVVFLSEELGLSTQPVKEVMMISKETDAISVLDLLDPDAL